MPSPTVGSRLLDAVRPDGLTLPQIDPTAAVAPNADPWAMIRPAEDLALYGEVAQRRLRLDATADREAGVLRVGAVHEDVPFTPAIALP
ncbi:hypothetical protein [Streptomyces longisporus]|uniref:hypothetical protein n=1 Tax=Streptomyces longisporus TaxID=1948 RepID=UPI0031D640B6